MSTPFFKSALVLLTLMLCLAATAATPEEETKFVDAVKKAFEEKKPGEVSKLTCWDGISEQAKKKDEEVYKLLMEEKDVTFGFKLVEADLKERKDHHVPPRPNLKIVKQLDLTMKDTRDHQRILGIIGFAVGEKDGKLLLVRELPEK
jgi:hypothetical protein